MLITIDENLFERAVAAAERSVSQGSQPDARAQVGIVEDSGTHFC